MWRFTCLRNWVLVFMLLVAAAAWPAVSYAEPTDTTIVVNDAIHDEN